MTLRRRVMLAALATPALAQAQTTGPIRLVVPFAPGGSVDVLARPMAPRLSEQLHQDVVVENRTGAAGLIAAEYVAQSPPTGTTLLVASGGQVTIAAALAQNLSFDPMKDLVPVSHLADVPQVIVVGPSVRQANLPALIAEAKAKPGEITYVSPGTGSVTHLLVELLNQQTGARFEHVPYRGIAQAMTDLIAGRVAMTLAAFASVKPALDRGEVRALAVVGRARLPQLPNVPTTAELGIDGLDVRVWIGLVARSGTPALAIARIDEAVRQVLTIPELRDRMEPLGMVAVGEGPAAFGATLAEDPARWRLAVTRGNITLN
ncbi:tripartite tricarboxylate transporter substrate binding protein [Roseomonas sp. CAU 1739]|uniref:Bug family tripartite tricarboxylate transporter substrate binding protein n=1 Tax=Roseomonas sp. CAU 1739 TaxID=3140364 RepID=UPI00325A7AA3